MMKQPRFFQIEPSVFLSDWIVQSFSVSEIGCYFLIIINLYLNGGVLPNDEKVLKSLCRAPRKFGRIWEKIKVKFVVDEQTVRHKRVDKEIEEARKRMEMAVESGKKGAHKRWGAGSEFDGVSLVFYDRLLRIIPAKSASDKTCFRNVTGWLKEMVNRGIFNEKIYERALNLANDAVQAKNPAAAFMALIKKELDYGKKG